jgi:hypothetical protein
MASQVSRESAGRPAAGAAARSRWLLPAALLALALPLTACDSTPALEEVRAGIESAMPGIDLVPEHNLHFGRFTIGLLHWAAGWDDERHDGVAAQGASGDQGAKGAGEAGGVAAAAVAAGGVEARREDFDGERMVRAIRRLDLATFRVRSMPQDAAGPWSPELARRFAAAGWSVVVHAAERDEQTWVFYRAGASLTDLYVVSLDRGELCLVRVGGRFDQAMASALARHPRAVMPALPASARPSTDADSTDAGTANGVG